MDQGRKPLGRVPRTVEDHESRVRKAFWTFKVRQNLEAATEVILWQNLCEAFKQLRACQFETIRLYKLPGLPDVYIQAVQDEMGAQVVYDEVLKALYDWRA